MEKKLLQVAQTIRDAISEAQEGRLWFTVEYAAALANLLESLACENCGGTGARGEFFGPDIGYQNVACECRKREVE